MRMHASSVLFAMSVCVMHPGTHCDNLFFVLYLFYQSRIDQFASQAQPRGAIESQYRTELLDRRHEAGRRLHERSGYSIDRPMRDTKDV